MAPHYAYLLAFGFANPWLLWGLALGAVPILIHLLHRRTYRETNWAAMRFLLEASRKNSRRMRLEQLILLAVRTLILLFAALAFAEPLVQALTPHARVRTPMQRVVVIDASFSMGAKVDAETRFDRAKKAARQIVSGSLPGDAINLLRIAERSGPTVVREPAFEPESVLAEIDRLPLTDEPGDLRPTLLEAAQVLADPHAPPTKEIIFISDFQRLTWAGDSSGRSDLHDVLQRLADRARIVLVDVGDGRTENVAVASLATADPVVLPDRPTRLRAGIRNFGPTNLAGLRVELYVDGYLAAFKSADVPAREETSVDFQHEFHAAGEHVVEARLPPDRLATDNQRWLSLPVAQRMNVLVVNGREGGRPADNASYYVQTVLAPSTSRESWSGATRPKVISEADLGAEDLSQYDCVFLCNVALVTPTEVALLQAYAEAGGGLVFTLGDRVKPENYNALLYHDGRGVLPAELGSPVGDARDPEPSQKGFTFDAGGLNHPIVGPFRGNPNAGLERAVTLEYFQVKLAPGSPGRVVLRFDSGDPAIIERQVGLGRSVLVTTSADVSWSTWPVHPTFPPIIHEIVRFAAGGRSQDRQRLIGEPLIRTLSSRETGARVIVKTPDGSEHTLRPLQNEKTAEAVFSETGTRGIYEMTVGPAPTSTRPPTDAGRGAQSSLASTSSTGKEVAAQTGQRELFAVNVDTRESDLETLDEKTLHSTTLAGIPYVRRSEWSEGPRDLTDTSAERSGLASWLLVAVLALLLVEPLLAWSFRRGFVLLCTLAVCGLAAPWIPRNAWGGLIIALLLAGGVVAVLRYGQERRSAGIVLETARRYAGPGRPWPFVRIFGNRPLREPKPRQTSQGGVD
ncbi:MAG TPA: BatA domain-containing protein [Planctomycetaceae bacterium]|nr:BatA domain-containing protein [Planctomycetaceae bacterium]